MHLLVVEDDPRLGRTLSRLLAEDRHVVDLVTDGASALDLLEATAGFEAVILDLGLQVRNQAQGIGIYVCGPPQWSWSAAWPVMRHLD